MIKFAVPNWTSKKNCDYSVLNRIRSCFFAFCKKGLFLNLRKSCIINGLRAQQTKTEIPIFTVCCHGIPLSGKNIMPSFKTAKQRYAVDFPPVYGTLNDNQLMSAQQNQEGDSDIPFTVTVYLFLAKNIMFFILTWFFTTYVFSSGSKKPGATHTYTKQGDPLTTTY